MSFRVVPECRKALREAGCKRQRLYCVSYKFKLIPVDHVSIIIIIPGEVRITFREFELEEGHDSLHIYRFQNQDNTYLTSLTGHIDEGTEMIFNANRLRFVFESDEQNNAAGFTFDFEGTEETGMSEQEEIPVSVWPNPSSSVIYVSVGEKCASSSTTMQLCDIFGRMLDEVTSAKVGETVSFDVSDLAKGVYLLRIVTEDGRTLTRKIVRQ